MYQDVHDTFIDFYAIANVNDEIVLFSGGRDEHEEIVGTTVAFFLNKEEGERFVDLPSLKRGREGHCMISLTSGVYVYGGHTGTGTTSEIEVMRKIEHDPENQNGW